MENYDDYLVAFLDILGFKEMIDKYSCNDIYELFFSIEKKNPRSPIVFDDAKKNIPYDKVSKIIMSDSVILYIKTEERNSLNAIIAFCRFLANALIKRDIPVLMRGGIARGKFFASDQYYFGEALNTAYNLQEKAAQNPRIIFFDGIKKSLDFNMEYYKEDTYRDDDGFSCVNYLYPTGEASANKIQNYCKEILNKIVDKSIREKHLYLYNLVERCCKK